MEKKCTVIIAAAGSGKRMGMDVKKQFLEIKGKPVLCHTIEAFEKNKNIHSIVIVTGEDSIDFCKELAEKYDYKKVEKVVAGGSERQFSVHNALKSIDKTDIVLIHDGARPFIMQEDINKVIEETFLTGASVMAVKSKDTIKVADSESFVKETPDRNLLWNIQTPQGFDFKTISNAYSQAEKDGFLGTDDSSLAERLGIKVKLVEGHYTNIKITTKDDLIYAGAILEEVR